MKYYICFYSTNYADEFDVEGFFLATEEQLNKLKADLKEEFNRINEIQGAEFTYCLGSNADVYYYSYKDVLKDYKFQEISEEEFNIISKRIRNYFGVPGPLFEY